MKVNLINNGNDIRVIPFNEEDPCIEITEEELELIYKGELKIKNGELVDNASKLKIQARITELKTLLAATDYKALKFAEGAITKTEYAETKVLRQSYRDEINKLEAEL